MTDATLHPYRHAIDHPDRPAFVVADTGAVLTYRALDEASNRAAQLFRSLGLRPGDRIGLLLRNGPDFPIAYWGAQRAGLMTAPLSTHLKPEEAAYILKDCNARVLVTGRDVGDSAVALAAAHASGELGVDAVFDVCAPPMAGAQNWQDALAAQPATPIDDETAGYYLVYSSGTTGRPKGIILPFTPGPIGQLGQTEQASIARLQGFDPLVTFNGAPLYHAAPLVSMIVTHRAGGTAVVLRKFGAEAALRAIDQWKVKSAQFVPTMFVRMLALPDEVRARYDVTSLEMVVHAAAPCPVDVKRRMMDWFGPIIHEYYSGSEAVGQCYITPEEWLRKPGSVGRAVWGILHICDDSGDEVPTGEDGLVYFESDRPFEYLNDPEKTAKSRHPRHPTWIALGDIGHVDADGYLFLTDRKDFMIISGGVNIYPQAAENRLIDHPDVADAAVIGIPDPEYGEGVLGIVQPAPGVEAGPALERRLIDHCRAAISNIACPRTIRFVEELPRLPTGKLAKHELRRRFSTVDA
ncbi:AMP-binding protein [Sphingomonas immobilis]|uniref:AMP-binding protein n=1 Tax=Sphingomonas immobilis TaxID=3063997 RepID=A0ABT8ZWB9_9SPHN|nr:AMP-binding protein [Sphingomonas sp. CA1-15]MDO7840772.1 AMP-binding protein [Sphingomonas sp. CA1-15]